MIEEDIHLRDYLNVLIKRRYTVFTVFITVFVIVLIATLSMTSLYTATTRVLIEKSQPQSMYNFPYVEYDPDFYETQYELIKSSAVAKRVINLLSLESSTYKAAFEKKIGKMVPGANKNTGKNSPAAQESKADLLGSFISSGLPIPLRDHLTSRASTLCRPATRVRCLAGKDDITSRLCLER